MQSEKIKSIRRIEPDAVFNLSIMQDESYVANGIIVHNCRSRTIPYFGTIPGKRDFRKSFDGVEYSKTDIAKVQKQIKIFRSKYWDIPLTEVPKQPS